MANSKIDLTVRKVPCSVLIIELTTNRVISMDDEFYRLTGYTSEDGLEGKKIKDCGFAGNQIFKQWKEQCLSAVLKKGFGFIESSIFNKEGMLIPIFICGTAFFNEKGKVCGRLIISRAEAVSTIGVNGEPSNGRVLEPMLDKIEEAAYVVAKEDFRILYANMAMEEKFGSIKMDCPCYEEIGKGSEVCTRCLIPSMKQEGVFSKGQVVYDSKRALSMDMETIEFNWNGEPAYLVVYNQVKASVQETKRKQNMRRMQERYAKVFYDGHDIITQIDVATGAFQMFSQDEDYPYATLPEGDDYMVEEKQLCDYAVYPDDREYVYEQIGYESMLNAFKNGEKTREAVFRMYENGELSWKEVKAFYYNNVDGEYIIMTTKAVNERENRRNAKYQDMTHMMDAVNQTYIVALDVDLTTDSFHFVKNDVDINIKNDEREKMPYSQYIENIVEIIHPADRGNFLKTCGRAELLGAIEDGITVRQCSCRYVRKNGRATNMDMQVVLLRKEADDHIRVMLTAKDQTKHMKEVQDIEKALEEMEGIATVKNQLLGRLSQEMHECGEKISAVVAEIQKYCGDNGELDNGLKKIESKTRHMISMAKNIQNISDMENDKVTIDEAPFDLKDFIQNITDHAELLAKRQHVTFQVVQKGEIGNRYQGDEVHIRQILMQLIENAVKHSVSGGHVTFYVKSEPAEEEMETFQFVIEDEGVGISEELLERIFYAAEKTGKEGVALAGGVGFGLIIVKKLVDMLGGEINVRSLRGKGTIFHITLKLKKMKEEMEVMEITKIIERQAKLFAGKRIIAAEDNTLGQDMIMAILGRRQIECVCVNHGAELVRKFEKSEPKEFSIILMDTEMPIQNGYQSAKIIRSLDREDAKDIPIVAMIENETPEILEKIKESGMNTYIKKPVEATELFSVMEEMI